MKDKIENIKQDMRAFIIDHYLLGSDKEGLKDDDSFLEKGIIDSIGVIELTHHIQDIYNIKVSVPEIVPDNLDTLNSLEAYITRKLKNLK